MNDAGREPEHPQEFRSDSAQQHSAEPAVRMLRAHIVSQVLFHTGAGKNSRVLSLGSGLGDTEMVLAPYVGEIQGVGFSPALVHQARRNLAQAGMTNVAFIEETFDAVALPEQSFDAAIAMFFLRHTRDLPEIARRIAQWVRPDGVVYALDSSRRRLWGAVGRALAPNASTQDQTPEERGVPPQEAAQAFTSAGFEASTEAYDFASSHLAGLLPAWGKTYLVARLADDWILRLAPLRSRAAHFQLIARKLR